MLCAAQQLTTLLVRPPRSLSNATDARVPQSHTVGGYQLGTWVDRQRRFHADGTLEADRERVSDLRICGISGYPALTWENRRSSH
jgi:hypothetical protein